ncbi:hypothetical protein ACO1O0_007831 [Amphichorda felina]
MYVNSISMISVLVGPLNVAATWLLEDCLIQHIIPPEYTSNFISRYSNLAMAPIETIKDLAPEYKVHLRLPLLEKGFLRRLKNLWKAMDLPELRKLFHSKDCKKCLGLSFEKRIGDTNVLAMLRYAPWHPHRPSYDLSSHWLRLGLAIFDLAHTEATFF